MQQNKLLNTPTIVCSPDSETAQQLNLQNPWTDDSNDSANLSHDENKLIEQCILTETDQRGLSASI